MVRARWSRSEIYRRHGRICRDPGFGLLLSRKFAQSNDLGVREVQGRRDPGVHARHDLSDRIGPDEGQGLVQVAGRRDRDGRRRSRTDSVWCVTSNACLRGRVRCVLIFPRCLSAVPEFDTGVKGGSPRTKNMMIDVVPRVLDAASFVRIGARSDLQAAEVGDNITCGYLQCSML